MKHALLRSSAFVRAAKKAVKKNPEITPELKGSLRLMGADIFHPKLHTHKLTGRMEGSWAVNVGYDRRIIFSFVQQDGKEAVLLESFGTHDEVY